MKIVIYKYYFNILQPTLSTLVSITLPSYLSPADLISSIELTHELEDTYGSYVFCSSWTDSVEC